MPTVCIALQLSFRVSEFLYNLLKFTYILYNSLNQNKQSFFFLTRSQGPHFIFILFNFLEN